MGQNSNSLNTSRTVTSDDDKSNTETVQRLPWVACSGGGTRMARTHRSKIGLRFAATTAHKTTVAVNLINGNYALRRYAVNAAVDYWQWSHKKTQSVLSFLSFFPYDYEGTNFGTSVFQFASCEASNASVCGSPMEPSLIHLFPLYPERQVISMEINLQYKHHGFKMHFTSSLAIRNFSWYEYFCSPWDSHHQYSTIPCVYAKSDPCKYWKKQCLITRILPRSNHSKNKDLPHNIAAAQIYSSRSVSMAIHKHYYLISSTLKLTLLC